MDSRELAFMALVIIAFVIVLGLLGVPLAELVEEITHAPSPQSPNSR